MSGSYADTEPRTKESHYLLIPSLSGPASDDEVDRSANNFWLLWPSRESNNRVLLHLLPLLRDGTRVTLGQQRPEKKDLDFPRENGLLPVL